MSGKSWVRLEGLIGSALRATYEWKQFGTPVALKLEADRPAIIADGADLSRIIVTAIDANNVPVETCDTTITFGVEGLGQLIGENPVRLRAAKMIILAQSGYVPGVRKISTQSAGLRSAQVTVKTLPVGPDVDLPKDLPAQQPTTRTLASQSRRRAPLLPRGTRSGTMQWNILDKVWRMRCDHFLSW